jgi:hypothetical protein
MNSVRVGARERAVARWIASSVRSSRGRSLEAVVTTSSPSCTNAMRPRMDSARSATARLAPDRRTARSTSTLARTLETVSGSKRRVSTSAPVSASGTTSFTMAEESRYSTTSPLQSLGPLLAEGVAEAGGDPAPGWKELQKVSLWRGGPPRAHQLLQGRRGLRQRRKHGDRSSAFGHLQALPSLDPSQVHTQVLAELPNPDSLPSGAHVAHGSTPHCVRWACGGFGSEDRAGQIAIARRSGDSRRGLPRVWIRTTRTGTREQSPLPLDARQPGLASTKRMGLSGGEVYRRCGFSPPELPPEAGGPPIGPPAAA